MLSFGLFYGKALPGVHDHLEESAVVKGWGRFFLVLFWNVAGFGCLTMQEGHKYADLKHIHKFLVESLVKDLPIR
jgi:hypothetical protein